MINRDDLQHWFTYHAPSDQQQKQYAAIRNAAFKFATTVLRNTPAGYDQTAAIQKIREATMIANASVACEQQ